MGNAVILVVLLLIGGASAASVLRWWLGLRFLRHVYDRGGSVDLGVAGAVLRSIEEEPLRGSNAKNYLSAYDEQPSEYHR